MKKRLLAFFLLTVLLLSACAENAETPTEDSAPVTSGDPSVEESPAAEETVGTEEELPAPPVEDMNGAVLTLLNYTPEAFGWANTLIFVEELNGETLNDALFERERMVEETYNASLEELATGDVVGTITSSVTAGDANFDAAMLFDARVTNILQQGHNLSWDELDLDFSKPWWDSAATEQYNFKGIQAAVSGAFSLYNYSTRHCYVFNEDIMNSVAPEVNLFDEVREGTWTIDRMYELGALASLDLNGDGSILANDDQYGIVSSVTRHYSALLAGANIKYIDRDENGDLYFAIPGSEYALSAISKFVQLNTGNDIYTSGTNDIGGGAESPIFYNNRALFIAAYVGEAARMRDIEFNIGIVPSPKYSVEQEQYYSLIEGGAQSILPKTLGTEAQHKTAVLLDAFGYYSFMESIPAYIDQVLMTKVARNEDSSEMLEIVFDTSFYDLGTGVWSADTKNTFTQNIFLPRSDTVVSHCERIGKAVSKKLERFIADISE
ncbi:MAG: hypothetical protein J6C42_09530 [Clostridia bacterium]|nr:hypothetical protein [Clostridia bacterium]